MNNNTNNNNNNMEPYLIWSFILPQLLGTLAPKLIYPEPLYSKKQSSIYMQKAAKAAKQYQEKLNKVQQQKTCNRQKNGSDPPVRLQKKNKFIDENAVVFFLCTSQVFSWSPPCLVMPRPETVFYGSPHLLLSTGEVQLFCQEMANIGNGTMWVEVNMKNKWMRFSSRIPHTPQRISYTFFNSKQSQYPEFINHEKTCNTSPPEIPLMFETKPEQDKAINAERLRIDAINQNIKKQFLKNATKPAFDESNIWFSNKFLKTEEFEEMETCTAFSLQLIFFAQLQLSHCKFISFMFKPNVGLLMFGHSHVYNQDYYINILPRSD